MSGYRELVDRLCLNGVKRRALGDVATVMGGYPFKSAEYSDSGVRVIRISDVQRGYISDKDVKYVSAAKTPEWRSVELFENDILVSLTGDVGKVARIDESCLPAALNQRVACIRADERFVEQGYLLHIMSRSEFESELMSASSGAAQKNLSMKGLRSYSIPVPPLEVQCEVVRILDSFQELDDALTAEIEARKTQLGAYRDELLGSRLEKICPNGVEYKKVKQVATIRNGKDHKSLADGDIPVYGSGGVMRYVDTASYDKPSVLLPRKGSLNNVFYVDTPFWNVDTIFHTVINECLVVPKYFYYVMCCAHIENYGTEGARPSLTQSILNGIYIPVPPIDVQQDIVATLDAMQSLIDALRSERDARRRQFAYYRDKLLAFPERG